MKSYGGMRRFTDAGEPWKTRPAMSKRDPWQTQNQPPGQSGPPSPDTDGEALLRQTPEVRAGAHQHEVLGLRARCSLCAYDG